MTPELGDVVEVSVGSTYRGIGILVPRLTNESKAITYQRFVQWISVADRNNIYNYDSGDYGIDEFHTVSVIWRPE